MPRAGPFGVDYPRALLVALSLTVVGALVIAAGMSSASFGLYNPAWDGTSELRAEVEAVGVASAIVQDTVAYDDVDPNNAIAVVLSPAASYGQADAAQLRAFVEAGGTLLVAEDFGPHADPLLAAVGASARFDGGLLRDEREHDRSPAMPVATDVTPHPLTGGASQVTFNHGTAVETNGATVLVNSSAYAYLDRNRDGRPGVDETVGVYPVATVERVGDGRVVVVGDPSVFINAMLDRPDNRAFTRGLLGTHDRMLIDVSHAARLPPLAAALLVVRDAPWLQVLLGAGVALAIGLWVRWPAPAGLVPSRFRRRFWPETTAETYRLTREEAVAYLERRHPEWDRNRVQRVTEGVIPRRHERRDDD